MIENVPPVLLEEYKTCVNLVSAILHSLDFFILQHFTTASFCIMLISILLTSAYQWDHVRADTESLGSLHNFEDRALNPDAVLTVNSRNI